MRRLVALGSLILTLAIPQAVAAGGWWSSIGLDRATVAPGQQVRVRTEVLFRSERDARQAQAREWRVYLLRGLDWRVVERAMGREFTRGWWTPGAAEAVDLGPVAVQWPGGILAEARASVRVPEVRTGTYSLMLCDRGCRRPLADVVPLRRFTVVADPIVAGMAVEVDALRDRLRTQTSRTAQVRAVAYGALREARKAQRDAERFAAANARLERHVRELDASGEGSLWLLGAAGLIALVAGAAGSFLLRRPRRRRRVPRMREAAHSNGVPPSLDRVTPTPRYAGPVRRTDRPHASPAANSASGSTSPSQPRKCLSGFSAVDP